MTSTAPRRSAPWRSPMPRSGAIRRSASSAVDEADRQVDEEDPVPADRLREHATGQEPDGGAGRRDEAVDADRGRALARLGEHRHDHPEDHGRGERPADALEEARSHQHLLALGEAAEQRGAGEEREPRQEDAAAPEQVAKAAGEQQQAAERDQVGVDDPGEAGLREAEVVLDGRQGHVHDRAVEDDHEHPRAEHHERQPARALGRGAGRRHRFASLESGTRSDRIRLSTV